MSYRRTVYLVPGFFGFTSFGQPGSVAGKETAGEADSLNYFQGVSEALERALDRLGLGARIVECETRPTASIRSRASRLLDDIAPDDSIDCDECHFVGHSTGGLDVRLLVTPGVHLQRTKAESELARKTRSVITVSTPHHGTPLASFFTTLAGKQALQLLASLASNASGRNLLLMFTQGLSALARADDWLGRDNTLLDGIARGVLRRMTRDEANPIWDYFRDIASDQGAVIQLTPESMHLFNAAVVDDPGIHYSSVLTAAPTPPFNFQPARMLSPTAASLAGAFTLLYALTSREHRHYPYPKRHLRAISRFRSELPFRVGRASNDGIVPTLSQVRGEVIGLFQGDHLDVVGQYNRGVPNSDWLPSGAAFDDGRFVETWDVVARRIAENSSRKS